MKRWFLTAILFVIDLNYLRAQMQLPLDSINASILKKVNLNHQSYFKSILNHRNSQSLSHRLDSIDADYLIITETKCFKTGHFNSNELYFRNGATLAFAIYQNGAFIDSSTFYNNGFIEGSERIQKTNRLSQKAFKLKTIQELPYNKTQYWVHGCVVRENEKETYRKQRESELKTTYQIQTVVNRKKGEMLVSFQIPPTKPSFKVVGYNPVWDF